MEVTVPKITNLLASNITEASFEHWLAVLPYAAGARVYILYSDYTELLSYGDCIFDQFFVDGAEWTYDGTNSEYDCSGAQAGDTKIYQTTQDVDSGDFILVIYEVKNYIAGEVKAYVQGGLGTARSANGTYLEVVTAGSTDSKIGVQGNVTFDGSITALSIKKIGAYYSRDVYESQAGANTNNYPPDDAVNWTKVSASNRWKMFDDYMASQAENPAKISVKVKSNKCNKLAYFLVEAKSVEYIVSDDSTTETSTTSITPAAAAIAITTQTHANSWTIGDKVEVYNTADQRAFFAGTLTAWTQATGVGEVTATVFDDPAGSAPYATWTMVKVYDHESGSLYQEEVLSWSDYFFSPIRFSTSGAGSFTYSYNTSVRVIFTGNANDTIRVGHLVVGHSSFLGGTKYGLKGSISDFSTKEANTFGEYALVKRAYSKELRYTINVFNTAVDQVFQTLTQLRATPCVWDSNNDKTSLSMAIAFGFFSDFEVMVPSNKLSECDLEIQGLT